MKKLVKKIYVMTPLLVCVLFFTGCFEKDEPEPSYCSQLDYEAKETARLTQVFEQNATESNCNSLRQNQISMLTKMLDCPNYSTNETQDLLNFWRSYDCSLFGGGNGGNNNAGNNNQSTGTATFWVQSDLGCGNITVTLNGQSRTISSYFSDGAPSCGANGTASFTLSAGTYGFTAKCGQNNWNGTVNVNNGTCSFMRLHL